MLGLIAGPVSPTGPADQTVTGTAARRRTRGTSAAASQEEAKAMSTHAPTFILIDCSASMDTPMPHAQMHRRIDQLREVLTTILREFRDVRLFAFSSLPRELEGFQQEDGLVLPEPDGGTALHLALDYIGARQPMSRLVVITDGVVDDPGAAIDVARSLAPLTIDAFHVGDETDRMATSFMRRLSLAGGTGRGRWGNRDLSKPALLAAELRGLLTGPKR